MEFGRKLVCGLRTQAKPASGGCVRINSGPCLLWRNGRPPQLLQHLLPHCDHVCRPTVCQL